MSFKNKLKWFKKEYLGIINISLENGIIWGMKKFVTVPLLIS